MRIIVGTKNEKKVHIVTKVFTEFFDKDTVEVVSHDADSKVPEAPHDQETYDGAMNRARECMTIGTADFYIGIESGIVQRYGHYFEEAWAVIISKGGKEQIGYSSGLLLPPVVVGRMENGEKHNDIMAYFDKEFNLPDDNKDTWSRYTGGHISRQISLEESLRNALIQSAPSERNLYNYK